MKSSQLDDCLREFRAFNSATQGQRPKRDNSRPIHKDTDEDRAIRELARILRGKIERRCVPFFKPRPRSSFRLVP